MGRTQKIAICFTFLLGSLCVLSPPLRTTTAYKSSVCFASLYRIITITRLVQSRDISWAKSDVFIWSSVEPSIGIISGCLPTLRPLLMYILESCFQFVPSTRKSSSGKGSRTYPMNPLETISKKRTRKISKKDDLESTSFTNFTQLEDEVEDDNKGIVTAVMREDKKTRDSVRRDRDHSGAWRPDEDEMCLTITTIHRGGSLHGGAGEGQSLDSVEREGITMTKKFEWDEARQQ